MGKHDKFLKMAEAMDKQAEGKLAPRMTNTTKRLAQARHAEREGQHLKRASELIRAYVKAAEEGRLTKEVQSATLTKDTFLRATSLASKPVSNGFHSYHIDTDKYYHNSGIELALRMLAINTPEQEARMAERMQELQLRRAIDELRNCDIPGFFPTPKPVIDQMLEIVCLEDGIRILEPSAGLGDIIHQVKLRCDCTVDSYEVNHSLCNILKMKGYHAEQKDFLAVKPEPKYDLVLMNPPFERKGGVRHVLHAAEFLKPGALLVAIVPPNQADEIDTCDSICIMNRFDLGPKAFSGIEAFRQTGVSVSIIALESRNAVAASVEHDDDDFQLIQEVAR